MAVSCRRSLRTPTVNSGKRLPAFMISPYNKAQNPGAAPYPARNRPRLAHTLHSGEPSPKSEHGGGHICARASDKPLRTCSPTHSIAADGCGRWGQCSPSSMLCYCISAPPSSSSPPPPLSASAPSIPHLFYRFIFPLPPPIPRFPAAIWRRHCLLWRAGAEEIITLALDSDSLCKL